MVQISRLLRKKLGEILVEEGLVREEQVHEALKRQKTTGELLGECFVGLGYVTEMDIARAIVRQFGLPYIDASAYRIPREAIQAVPREFLWQNSMIVLDKIGKTLVVAVAGIVNPEVLEKLEKSTGSQVFVYVSTLGLVKKALQKYAPLDGKPAGAPRPGGQK